MTGGVIIEIADDEEGEKADVLRDKINEALDSSKIRVSRPVKKIQMRLTEIDDSITVNEIRQEITKVDSCKSVDIDCSEVKYFRGNLGVTWVRCPMRAALKIKENGDSGRNS